MQLDEFVPNQTIPGLLLDRDEAREVLEHIASLGYELVPAAERRSDARYVEADDERNKLFEYLCTSTPLRKCNSIETHDFMRRLLGGRCIQKPDQHPSGLKTTEPPYVDVKPIGERFGRSARKI